MLLAVPLIVLLTAFVALGTAALQHSTSTGIVNWLGRVVGNIPIVGGVLSLDNILKLDRWVLSLIGKQFGQVEKAAVGWLAALAQVSRRHSKAALGLAAPVWGLAYWLVHTEIGRQAHTRDVPIKKTADQAKAAAIAARDDLYALKRGGRTTIKQSEVTRIERVVMPHAKEWSWINEHWGGVKRAVALAAAGALAPTLPRVKPLAWPYGLTPTGIRRRLHRLEGLFGVTAAAALVASVFRVTPRCVTDGNIGRIMRKLCGLSPRALADLLGLLADALLLTNICRAITLLEDGLGVVQPEITAFITDLETWACYGDNEAPPKLPEPVLNLPTLRPIALSAEV